MVSIMVNFMYQHEWVTGTQIKHCFWEFLGKISM